MTYFSFKKTEKENKDLYRELAKQHHPDRGGNSEIFKAISIEYEFYQKRIKEGVTPDQAKAYDNVFANTSFISIEEMEAYYLKNKPALDEIISRFILRKKPNRKMDDDIVTLGLGLGKSIFNLLK